MNNDWKTLKSIICVYEQMIDNDTAQNGIVKKDSLAHSAHKPYKTRELPNIKIIRRHTK